MAHGHSRNYTTLTDATTDIRERMMIGQYAAVALLCFIAAVGIVRARGARRCASAIAVANIIPVFLLVSVSVMIIDPGS